MFLSFVPHVTWRDNINITWSTVCTAVTNIKPILFIQNWKYHVFMYLMTLPTHTLKASFTIIVESDDNSSINCGTFRCGISVDQCKCLTMVEIAYSPGYSPRQRRPPQNQWDYQFCTLCLRNPFGDHYYISCIKRSLVGWWLRSQLTR